MSELLALSVSVAVLGGIWAFIALGPLAGFALVWVGFIAAGCFFAAGGDTKSLTKTIVGIIYGAIIAWIALLIIAKVPVPALGTVWPAIVVGVTVFFLVIVASVDLLSCVPANVYGYAALVGYTLSAGKLGALTAADNSNPLFLIAVSAIFGGRFGYLMGQLAWCAETQGGQIAADQRCTTCTDFLWRVGASIVQTKAAITSDQPTISVIAICNRLRGTPHSPSEVREVVAGIASGRYQQRGLDRRRIEACTTQWLNVAARCVALVPTAAAGICAAGN